jgi:hypothetical protein
MVRSSLMRPFVHGQGMNDTRAADAALLVLFSFRGFRRQNHSRPLITSPLPATRRSIALHLGPRGHPPRLSPGWNYGYRL